MVIFGIVVWLHAVRGQLPDSRDSRSLRMAVVLLKGGFTPADYNILGPAIELAMERSKLEFNITLVPFFGLYDSDCVSEDRLDGLSQVVRALDNSVDFMLGPACTADLVIAAKLTTIYKVPLATGAGHLVDNTGVWTYTKRMGYNIVTQWSFFLTICRRFGWSNMMVWYETDSNTFLGNGRSTYTLCRPRLVTND